MNVKNIEKNGNQATIVVEIDKELLESGVSNERASFRAQIIRICSSSGGTGINIDINSSNFKLSTVVTDFTSSFRIYGSNALMA